jgi:GNAT superfamily N-acetyltransferase
VPSICLATPADARSLAQLRWDFRASVATPVEDEAAFVDRCTAWMRPRLEPGSSWTCWVLEDEGDVAGQLWLQLIEKLPNPVPELEQHAYITNVYVAPRLRGAGLGAVLLETALAYCREQSVDSVILWPTPQSRTLYERHGFAVRDDLMELNLDGGRHL